MYYLTESSHLFQRVIPSLKSCREEIAFRTAHCVIPTLNNVSPELQKRYLFNHIHIQSYSYLVVQCFKLLFNISYFNKIAHCEQTILQYKWTS